MHPNIIEAWKRNLLAKFIVLESSMFYIIGQTKLEEMKL